MQLDVYELVRGDHECLDGTLRALMQRGASDEALRALLGVLRHALAVHVEAEAAVLRLLITNVRGPRVVYMLAAQTRAEHIDQLIAVDDLARVRPGSSEWYERVDALRVRIRDHSRDADIASSTFRYHVPSEVQSLLTTRYAHAREQARAARMHPTDLAN